MAYDEYLAERISRFFEEAKANFYTKKMIGGLCFMVNEKMACGIHFDKKKETDLLMARIGEMAHDANIDKKGCHPMDFTGRPMRGYVFVTPEAFDTDDELAYWLNLCLDFNPQAKMSKKRRPKA